MNSSGQKFAQLNFAGTYARTPVIESTAVGDTMQHSTAVTAGRNTARSNENKTKRVVKEFRQTAASHVVPLRAYFTAVFFLSFFFFRCLISDVTERISTKLGHIFTYDCYLKNLVRTLRSIYPSPWAKVVAKTLLWDRL